MLQLQSPVDAAGPAALAPAADPNFALVDAPEPPPPSGGHNVTNGILGYWPKLTLNFTAQDIARSVRHLFWLFHAHCTIWPLQYG
jgi:hypothetical protein